MKSGFKSSELFTTVIAMGIGGALSTAGIINPEASADVNHGLELIIGGLMVVIPALFYNFKRVELKKLFPTTSPVVSAPAPQVSVPTPEVVVPTPIPQG